jgi:hypothetical protein
MKERRDGERNNKIEFVARLNVFHVGRAGKQASIFLLYSRKRSGEIY